MADMGVTHTMSVSVRVFCEELVARLVSAGRGRLPFDNPDMAAAMADITTEVLTHARLAFSRGFEDLGDDLLTILDEIAPNPNTGAFDGFWSALRDLQPSHAGVLNPNLDGLRLKNKLSEDTGTLEVGPNEIWSALMDKAATHIKDRL